MLQTKVILYLQHGRVNRNFCDGIEMKFTSPLRDIQQAGALETPAKSVTPFPFG